MVFGGAALSFSGCGPKYPKCDNDENCADKGEFCVNGLCQQCRDNSQCKGAGMECSAGKCVQRPGYCDANTPCPGKQKCRDNECGAECMGDNECSADSYCEAGSCQQRPQCGEHATTPACPNGQDCVGGHCEEHHASCNTDPVYFDLDRYDIRDDQRAKLDSVAECLKGGQIPNVQLAGHCDERGTEEYNMALGQKRADAAKKYLTTKGVEGKKLKTISYGKERPADPGHDESAWAKNRRVEFGSN
jgi:peptidoglycan-associated lipoprotein